MKKSIFFALSAAAMLCFTACVDESYDLSQVDKTITIIPGLTIPLNNEGSPTNLYESFFKNTKPDIKGDDEGVMTIGSRHNQNRVWIDIPKENIGVMKEITMPWNISIECASLLADIIPGAVINLDASPVCEVTNPLKHALQLSGKAKCGSRIVPFGPLEVPAGTNKIRIEDKSIAEFLHPVKENITLTDLVLSGVLATDSEPATKAEASYTFDITAYIPMEFNEGEEINVAVPLDDISEGELKQFADENEISFKSFILNVDVTNNAPFEITATASATSGGNKASASISPAVAAGSVASPAITRTAVTSDLPEGVTDLSDIYVYIKAKATASPSVLKEEHTLTFKAIDIVFNKGIQLEL